MTGPLLTLLKAATLTTYTAAGYWGEERLYGIAARHARAAPDRFAVRDRHRRLTYAALVDAADRLAGYFSHHRARATRDACASFSSAEIILLSVSGEMARSNETLRFDT
jgi:non-ribosomal peptide synthetase component E (peptide arylation enzyme)